MIGRLTNIYVNDNGSSKNNNSNSNNKNKINEQYTAVCHMGFG
jgi:hypothetical protein